jgi:hypothetical protein
MIKEDDLFYHDPYEGNKYAEIIGNKYTDVIDELEKTILNSTTGENEFLVVSIEAGLGKSIETNRIIHDRMLDFTEPQKNIL